MSTKFKTILTFFFIGLSINIVTSQVVKGTVFDKKNNEIILFANLTFTDSLNNVYSCTSDIDGNYSIDLKKSGSYEVICQSGGYISESVTIKIEKGQTLTNDFYLAYDTGLICGPDIIITEKPYESGDLTMTQSQYKIMPASFQDPARILIKYPGFSTPNDGANAIIFRGMPTESARWQLFGADIVNPNHLSNAGTANDLATGNAGGVNALSGSVLGYYHFEANPADISYSNVMSGVSNMKMAPKIKSFVDINLIGLEAGLGFQRGNKNYYATYRYSFVGLLDKLGVNFGNEKIGYQDMSIYGDIIKNGDTSLKFFGTYGNSRNIHNAIALTDTITRAKDIQNIEFKNNIAIFGLDFTHITEKFDDRFQSTLVASFLDNSRGETTNPLWSAASGIDIQSQNSTNQGLISSHTSFSNAEYEDLQMSIGLRMNYHMNQYFLNTSEINHNNYFSAYNYIKFSQVKLKKWPIEFDFGSGLYYDSRFKKMDAEPYVSTRYLKDKNTKIVLNYRYVGFDNYSNPFLMTLGKTNPRIMGHHVQLSYDKTHGNAKWNTQIFYHHFSDITNFVFASDTMNFLNIFNGSSGGYDYVSGVELLGETKVSTARVYGASADWNLLFKERWNFQINGSVFRSQYTLPDDKRTFYNGRYDFGFTSGCMISYAYNFSNKEKYRNITSAISTHYRGGQREPSLSSNTSDIYDYSSAFANRMSPYSRVDFRIVYNSQRNGSRKKHRWSLDIQNLLNRENDGFRYYDPYLKNVILQKQLGLIPVLSYRLEW